MSDEPELTYWDFVTEAFNARPPLPGLGSLPLNWMGLGIFGTLGILNPGFWFIGAAAELGFLAAMAQSPRFRSYVRGRRLQAKRQHEASQWRERQEEMLAQLSEPSQARFRAYVERLEQTRSAREKDELTGMIGDVADDGLHRLRWVFLKLLASSETLTRQVDPGGVESLRRELKQYEQKLEDLGEQGDSRIRRSLEQTRDILRQRVKNLEGAEQNLAYIESELQRIRHQSELIIEEAALATDADALSSRIDAVTSTFAETHEWMKLHKELLTDFDVESDRPRPPPDRVTTR